MVIIETYKCSTKNCKKNAWVKGGLCNSCLFDLMIKNLDKEKEVKEDKINVKRKRTD